MYCAPYVLCTICIVSPRREIHLLRIDHRLTNTWIQTQIRMEMERQEIPDIFASMRNLPSLNINNHIFTFVFLYIFTFVIFVHLYICDLCKYPPWDGDDYSEHYHPSEYDVDTFSRCNCGNIALWGRSFLSFNVQTQTHLQMQKNKYKHIYKCRVNTNTNISEHYHPSMMASEALSMMSMTLTPIAIIIVGTLEQWLSFYVQMQGQHKYKKKSMTQTLSLVVILFCGIIAN